MKSPVTLFSPPVPDSDHENGKEHAETTLLQACHPMLLTWGKEKPLLLEKQEAIRIAFDGENVEEVESLSDSPYMVVEADEG